MKSMSESNDMQLQLVPIGVPHAPHAPVAIVNQLSATGRQTGIRSSSNQLHWGFVVTTTETDKLKTIFQYGWMVFCGRVGAAARCRERFVIFNYIFNFNWLFVRFRYVVCGLCQGQWTWDLFLMASTAFVCTDYERIESCVAFGQRFVNCAMCVHGFGLWSWKFNLIMRNGFCVEIEMEGTSILLLYVVCTFCHTALDALVCFASNYDRRIELKNVKSKRQKKSTGKNSWNQLILEMLCIYHLHTHLLISHSTCDQSRRKTIL